MNILENGNAGRFRATVKARDEGMAVVITGRGRWTVWRCEPGKPTFTQHGHQAHSQSGGTLRPVKKGRAIENIPYPWLAKAVTT